MSMIWILKCDNPVLRYSLGSVVPEITRTLMTFRDSCIGDNQTLVLSTKSRCLWSVTTELSPQPPGIFFVAPIVCEKFVKWRNNSTFVWGVSFD